MRTQKTMMMILSLLIQVSLVTSNFFFEAIVSSLQYFVCHKKSTFPFIAEATHTHTHTLFFLSSLNESLSMQSFCLKDDEGKG